MSPSNKASIQGAPEELFAFGPWQQRLHRATNPLPGATAYTNERPMHVELAYDGAPLVQFLGARHPHLPADYWHEAIAAGRLLIDDKAVVDPGRRLRAGNRLLHRVHGVVEPPVATTITVVHYDDALVALNKPAPLPVHPCGRFNRNTLMSILRAMYPHESLKLVHRLDADTTGLQLLARSKDAARHLGQQFEARTLQKTYVARVHGRLGESMSITQALDSKVQARGARTLGRHADLLAHTDVEPLQCFDDGTSLLQLRPHTGRTNQIRLHLASVGYPIVGDAVYGSSEQAADSAPFSGGPLCLHAWKLAFVHPTQALTMSLEAPLPPWAVE